MSEPHPCQQLTRMITSYWVSRTIYIAAKLRIADHLKDGPSFGKLLDLHMMVMAGGLERTEAEHRRLLAAHGFRLTRVVPTAGDVSVVEGRPA